jgi:ankyrin repeat protein
MLSASEIFLAASLGHSDTCKRLVENGLEVDAASELVRRYTAAAIRSLRTRRRTPARERSSRPDSRSRPRRRPLPVRRAAVSAPQHGWTALHVAAGKGQVDTIKVLLGLGANVDHADKVGFTPLMYTADKNKTEALAALVEAKANVNAIDRVGVDAARALCAHVERAPPALRLTRTRAARARPRRCRTA